MHYSLHDKLAIAHALFACIATLFILPVALLAGRYRRRDGWFKIHVLFNGITIFLVILVFGLGMGAVKSVGLGTQFSGVYSDLHHKVGLSLFLLVILQGILGVAAHKRPSDHFLRRLHVPVGVLTAAGLVWQTWEGMHNEWAEMSTSMTVTPEGVQIIFWVVFMVSAVAYAVAVGQATLRTIWGQGMGQSERCTDIEVENKSVTVK